ncbi:hypothetical protein D3C78_1393860 [compost metagenome]
MCRRQAWNVQIGDHRRRVDHRTHRQRRHNVPVGQYAAGHRTYQDRGDGRSLHQAVGFDQLFAAGDLTQNAVFGG